jgi:hypothetical protein
VTKKVGSHFENAKGLQTIWKRFFSRKQPDYCASWKEAHSLKSTAEALRTGGSMRAAVRGRPQRPPPSPATKAKQKVAPSPLTLPLRAFKLRLQNGTPLAPTVKAFKSYAETCAALLRLCRATTAVSSNAPASSTTWIYDILDLLMWESTTWICSDDYDWSPIKTVLSKRIPVSAQAA